MKLFAQFAGNLDALEAQVAEAHANSTYAIAAVNYLFCMIKGLLPGAG